MRFKMRGNPPGIYESESSSIFANIVWPFDQLHGCSYSLALTPLLAF